MKRALIIALAFATILSFGSSAGGITIAGTAARSDTGIRGGEKILPKFVRKWQGEKVRAADLVATGAASVDTQGRVRLPNGRLVDYRLQGTGQIVTILAEFTDPAHNQIAEPDRTLDNSTYWISDFNRAHYQDMLFVPGGGSYGFPSMRDYYLQQSSGRFAVDGQVSEWVQIPHPESFYGGNSGDGPGSDNANGPVYRVVEAALQGVAAGSGAGLNLSPSAVDVEDRYDCDGDGNFNESDGYIDHLQIFHAGEGEEAGGGAQGGDSIWSHRWYANFNQTSGPAGCQLGGYQLPGTELWAGDYTVQPENGGVGVAAHEFGHDLGLPDLYDTAGANDNAVSFWSVMSDGGWPSDDPQSLDTKPVHMGPWEKLALGWLGNDLATATLGQDKKIQLGPAEGRTAGNAQAIRINLPNYSKTTTVFTPDGADAYYYYSGQGDNLDNSMSRAVPVGSTSISFRTNYDIEKDWDYAYLRASTDGGATWTNVHTSLSTNTSPNGQNFGEGITGTSGGWVTATATLPAGTTNIGFRYWTDGAVVGKGFAVDSIAVGGLTDTAEDPSPWTFDGFSRVTNGQITTTHFHYYLVESRNYLRNDTSLRGTYQFLSGNWLEKQPYADGVLIWYRNSGYADNNVSEHPGFGQVLVVDSHPAPNVSPDGHGYLRERWQTWDASFGFKDHSVTLHEYRGILREKTYDAPAVSSFFDSSPTAYWDPRIPYNSVKTAGSGLKITLLSVSADGTTYLVRVHT